MKKTMTLIATLLFISAFTVQATEEDKEDAKAKKTVKATDKKASKQTTGKTAKANVPSVSQVHKYSHEDLLFNTLQLQIDDLHEKQAKTRDTLALADSAIAHLNDTLKAERCKVDSLDSVLNVAKDELKRAEEKLGMDISDTQSDVSENAASTRITFHERTIYGSIAFLFALVLSIIIYILLHRRIKKGTMTTEELEDKIDDIQAQVQRYIFNERKAKRDKEQDSSAE